MTTNAPAISTVGELRESGHQQKTLRHEIRDNLLAALREGRDPWPGLHGFDTTVIPQLERALLAGHDVVLLGERGQGKTRLLRTMVGLLDEWTPVIAGAELGEHPYDPITHESKRRAREEGEHLPVEWRHRDERYAEKLATPDTSVADLIGDVDPMKVAEGRSLGDPETIHFGLIPRSHRGIVAINELPDLAERIQVAMLNVMEERDIQIRGYVLRLPLDTLVVASANPEDYTNRGRIITPLKDRFGAEIRTHYPIELEDEIAVIRQEADLVAAVPDHLVEILARFTRALRESSSVDQRSGVSARFAIAGAETIAAAALHRATSQGEDEAVARVVDLETAVDVLGGKIEFETGEEGREAQILEHLLRRATAETVRSRLAGVDLGLLVQAIEDGASVSTGEQVTARDFLGGLPVLGESELYDEVCDRLDATNDGERAGAIELALEGLFLAQKVSKESDGGETDLWLSRRRSRYGRYDGGPDPLAPPVDLAEALDAIGEDVMAGYSPERAMREFLRRGGQRPARSRRAGSTGRGEAARAAAEAQPRRHPPGGPRAARPRRARGAQAARPRRRHGRRRPRAARDADGQPAEQYGGRGLRALGVRLGQPGGPRGLREDQGPPRPGDARPALQGHEAGARERHRRGPPGDQRDAGRPQRAARQAPPRRGHRAGLRRLHGQARRLLPGEPAEHRRADGRARATRRGGPADAQLDDAGAARRARCPCCTGVRQPRADAVAEPARRQPARAATR